MIFVIFFCCIGLFLTQVGLFLTQVGLFLNQLEDILVHLHFFFC